MLEVGQVVNWGGKEYTVTSAFPHQESITLNGNIYISLDYFLNKSDGTPEAVDEEYTNSVEDILSKLKR